MGGLSGLFSVNILGLWLLWERKLAVNTHKQKVTLSTHFTYPPRYRCSYVDGSYKRLRAIIAWLFSFPLFLSETKSHRFPACQNDRVFTVLALGFLQSSLKHKFISKGPNIRLQPQHSIICQKYSTRAALSWPDFQPAANITPFQLFWRLIK